MFEQIVEIGGSVLRDSPIRTHAERRRDAGLFRDGEIADTDFDGHFRRTAVHGSDSDGTFVKGGGLVVWNANVQPDGFKGADGDIKWREIHQRIGP